MGEIIFSCNSSECIMWGNSQSRSEIPINIQSSIWQISGKFHLQAVILRLYKAKQKEPLWRRSAQHTGRDNAASLEDIWHAVSPGAVPELCLALQLCSKEFSLTIGSAENQQLPATKSMTNFWPGVGHLLPNQVRCVAAEELKLRWNSGELTLYWSSCIGSASKM